MPLGDGRFALIDAADAPRVLVHRWYRASAGYAEGKINGRRVLMHRFVLEAPAGRQIDHVNGYRLDNRRANLRFSTQGENTQNQCAQARGRSRFKGVVWSGDWHRGQRPWVARIKADGRRLLVGYFLTEEEAARAYDDAAREHFGSFACVNFPRDGERPALQSEVAS